MNENRPSVVTGPPHSYTFKIEAPDSPRLRTSAGPATAYSAAPPLDQVRHLMSDKPLRQPRRQVRRGPSIGVSPARTDDQGRIFRDTGEQVVVPGLEPEKILKALAEDASGLGRPLREIAADRRRPQDTP